MRAAVIPGINETWDVREVPTPEPGPGEVLVRVEASGMCVNDVHATRGHLPFPSVVPAITGHEPVGVVVEVGPGVRSRVVGDRVGATWVRGTCGRCDYCRLERPLTGAGAFLCPAPTTTGFSVQGGHAEYMAVAAAQTVLLPEGLRPEVAAPVLCAGYTAWSALRAADPAPNERVAVLGIGAIGHLALQLARTCGFETVAVTSSPDKHDLARQLGADEVVSDGEQLRDIGGAEILLATGASHAATARALPGLRVGGRLVLAGIDPEPFTFPPLQQHPFFALDQQVVGATHGGVQHLREVLDLVAAGRVTPMVETFALEDAATAFDRVAKNDVRFRAVLTF